LVARSEVALVAGLYAVLMGDGMQVNLALDQVP
jgi:hypothetical protein